MPVASSDQKQIGASSQEAKTGPGLQLWLAHLSASSQGVPFGCGSVQVPSAGSASKSHHDSPAQATSQRIPSLGSSMQTCLARSHSANGEQSPCALHVPPGNASAAQCVDASQVALTVAQR
jgi:hypothetical protein